MLALLVLFAACRGAPSADKQDQIKTLDGIREGEERRVGDDAMFLHRIQVWSPSDDGWQRAGSTEGGFSVAVPVPYNDFRVRSTADDGVEVRAHTVGGKSAGGVAWSATCLARRDGEPSPKAPSDKDVIEVKGDPPAAHMRSIQLGDLTYLLIVEAQGSDPLPPEHERLRFLRSFERQGEPLW